MTNATPNATHPFNVGDTIRGVVVGRFLVARIEPVPGGTYDTLTVREIGPHGEVAASTMRPPADPTMFIVEVPADALLRHRDGLVVFG